jgi:uncharacterized protein YaaR (DUF327 family)
MIKRLKVKKIVKEFIKKIVKKIVKKKRQKKQNIGHQKITRMLKTQIQPNEDKKPQ